ncbi:MAG: GIY-YIG nuclease family protein [Pacificimonas sp.]
MAKAGWVYAMANRRNGTLYIGVTSDLAQRVYEHKEMRLAGFTKRHGCDRLVWYEEFPTIDEAITFEKRMKAWKRDWKVREIEERNLDWDDLALRGLS